MVHSLLSVLLAPVVPRADVLDPEVTIKFLLIRMQCFKYGSGRIGFISVDPCTYPLRPVFWIRMFLGLPDPYQNVMNPEHLFLQNEKAKKTVYRY
jgi:hypothetical protein